MDIREVERIAGRLRAMIDRAKRCQRGREYFYAADVSLDEASQLVVELDAMVDREYLRELRRKAAA